MDCRRKQIQQDNSPEAHQQSKNHKITQTTILNQSKQTQKQPKQESNSKKTTRKNMCAHKTIQQQPKRNTTVVTDQLHDAAQSFENQIGKGTKSMLEMPPRKKLQVLLNLGSNKVSQSSFG